MKQYEIKTVQLPDEIDDAPAAHVDCFPDSCTYRPETTAAVVYLEDRGFLCRMRCKETLPRAFMTEPDSDTYKDSCLEWFINFNPARGEEYLNLEANSLGTLHCKFGKDRYVRHSLEVFGAERPMTKAVVSVKEWYVDYFIPMRTIQTLFGVKEFHSGDWLRGNFYKCGNETAQPHYGMWNRVELSDLDFHRPDYFGTFFLL